MGAYPYRRHECIKIAIPGISVAITGHSPDKNGNGKKMQSLTIQAAKLAAMMPFWLCYELDGIARIA